MGDVNEELVERCAIALHNEHWNGVAKWEGLTDDGRAFYMRLANRVLTTAHQHESERLAGAERVVEHYGDMLRWLMNVAHPECRCNTIANPCPRRRIRVLLETSAYPPKPARGQEGEQ